MTIQSDWLFYTRDKFVNRTNEITLVTEKAQRLTAGLPVDKRLVVFRGACRSGKSWLLREIERQLKEHLPTIPVIYLDMVQVSIEAFQVASRNPSRYIDQASLHQIVATSFDTSELFDLCHRLGVEHEDLHENDKVWGLINYLDRRDRLTELVRVCYQLRPNILGWNAFEEISKASDVMQVIIWQVGELVGFQTYKGAKWGALIDAFLGSIRKAGGLILLLDHLDELSRNAQETLENRFLSPLAVLPGTLIISGKRLTERPWIMPELHLKSREYDLHSFDLPTTQEQLQKQIPGRELAADEVQPLSAGYPGLNYILGMNWGNRARAIEQCAQILIGNEVEDLRPYLEALCVLRSFHESAMPAMFTARLNGPLTEYSVPICRDIRERLTQARLARWDKAKGNFNVDPAVKAALENTLRENNFALWIVLHCAAHCLYNNWATRYSHNSEWQIEAAYHADCLRAAGYNPNQCDCQEEKS